MVQNIFLLLVGFTALILGANWLVNGASALSRRFGISELVIGLTIVAFGTSTPEMVVNLVASKNGLSDVVLGNVIGSNIFNLLLILGVSGTIYPLVVQRKTVWLEIPISFFAVLILLLLANTGKAGMPQRVSFPEGLVLLLCFGGFMVYIFRNLKNDSTETGEVRQQKISLSTLLIFLGLAGLVVGGKMVVKESTDIAVYFGMSERLIGLTIISIGTSLPELATSVVAAIKKNSDIAIGNIVGSNIFNIFLILGLCAINSPIQYTKDFNTDLSLLGIFTMLLFASMFTGKKMKLDRMEAIILASTFIGYMLYIISRN